MLVITSFQERLNRTQSGSFVPNELSIDGYETIDFSVSVNLEKLKPGRNFGELIVSDKRIPVWVWYETLGETALTLDQNQPGSSQRSKIHYTRQTAAH